MLGTEPHIVERYVRTGKVKLVYRHILDHGARSLAASDLDFVQNNDKFTSDQEPPGLYQWPTQWMLVTPDKTLGRIMFAVLDPPWDMKDISHQS